MIYNGDMKYSHSMIDKVGEIVRHERMDDEYNDALSI